MTAVSNRLLLAKSAVRTIVAVILLKVGRGIAIGGSRIGRRLIVEAVCLSTRALLDVGYRLQTDPDGDEDLFLKVLVEGDVIPGNVSDPVQSERDTDDEN